MGLVRGSCVRFRSDLGRVGGEIDVGSSCGENEVRPRRRERRGPIDGGDGSVHTRRMLFQGPDDVVRGAADLLSESTHGGDAASDEQMQPVAVNVVEVPPG